MTATGFGYMPLNRQLFGRSMAEALGDLLAQRYRTAKELARAVRIDVATAENLRKGHLSITTLQKVLSAEGRELWNRLGDELFGETFYAFEERRIQAAIREAEGAHANLVRLRAQSEELLSRAPRLDDAGPRTAADRHWGPDVHLGAEVVQQSDCGAGRTRHPQTVAHRDTKPRRTGG